MLDWVCSVLCEMLPAELIADKAGLLAEVDEEPPVTSGGVCSHPANSVVESRSKKPKALKLFIA